MDNLLRCKSHFQNHQLVSNYNKDNILFLVMVQAQPLNCRRYLRLSFLQLISVTLPPLRPARFPYRLFWGAMLAFSHPLVIKERVDRIVHFHSSALVNFSHSSSSSVFTHFFLLRLLIITFRNGFNPCSISFNPLCVVILTFWRTFQRICKIDLNRHWCLWSSYFDGCNSCCRYFYLAKVGLDG